MSISNWNFAGYTGRKVKNRQTNQVQKSILWTRDFKNQVQIDRGVICAVIKSDFCA